MNFYGILCVTWKVVKEHEGFVVLVENLMRGIARNYDQCWIFISINLFDLIADLKFSNATRRKFDIFLVELDCPKEEHKTFYVT